MPKLTVPGAHPVELHYDDTQTAGTPVVLIHGWPLSGRSWELQVAPLVEAGHRVITYDRRGFGASSQPWGGYDYDTFAADLDALLTHLDLTDVTLVGFSMGGGEVARYLSKFGSKRVAKAVFAGSVTPYLHITDGNPDGGLDDATAAAFAEGITTDRVKFLKSFFKDFFKGGGLTSDVSAEQHDYALHIAEFASPKGTLDCTTAFGTTDFRGDLATITVPTLVIHGDHDKVVPIEASGERTAKAIPGSQFHVVEGGAHAITVSHPDEFNEVLIAFVDGKVLAAH